MRKLGTATAALLTAITLAGGAIRFAGIRERGPFLWDDAILHLESTFLLDSERFLEESLHRKAAEARTGENLWTWDSEGKRFRDEVGGIPMRHGRPGQNVILAVAMSVLGRVDWAGPACSALFGTLTIPAVYFLARRLLGGRRAALFASIGIAALGIHVRFSREGLAEANSLFFVVLGVLAYARSRPDLESASAPAPPGGSRGGRPPGAWLAVSGFLTGCAFTIQDRTLLLFPVVLASEIAASGGRAGLRRFTLFFSLACLPILAFELPFYAILLVLRRHAIAFPYRTYLEQVAGVVANHLLAHRYYHLSAPARAAGLLAYPYLLVRTCGPPFALLAGAGAVLAWLRPTPARRFLLLWSLFCWIFLGLTVPLARYASILLAPLVLLAASALESSLAASTGPGPARGHLTAKTLCCALAGVLALAWEGGLAWGIASGVRPGYRDAVAWIAAGSENEVATHVSTQPFVSMVYAGVAPVAPPPDDEAGLARLRTTGHRYFLVDLIQAFSLGPFAGRARVIDDLAARCAPARTFPNAWAAWPEYLFEFNFDTLRTWRLLATARGRLDSIRVYDLDRCDAGAGGGAPQDAAPKERDEAARTP